MVRVAIAGLGFMGKTHLGIYRQFKNVEVVALCDGNTNALNITRLDAGGNIQAVSGDIDLSGVRKYTDFDKMLADGGIDVIDLCLPTFLHVDYAVKAMHAGCHVLCEKPMALTVEGTQTILQTVRATGKLFSVGQCLRYWPAYTEIKKLLDDGRYGKVNYAEFARFSTPPIWGWDNWLFDEKRSGDAALELHIHDADMVMYLFGFPKSLRSVGVFTPNGSISHIATVYAYPDCAIASTGGWLCSSTFGFNMRALFVLEKATIELDFSKQPVVMVYPQDNDKYALPLSDGDGYYYELQDFIAGVERGKLSRIVTPESAADSVKLCLAEIRSAKEHREIVF
jgi:predicted dehydrogenase